MKGWPGQETEAACTRALKLLYYQLAPTHYFCQCGNEYTREEFWETFLEPHLNEGNRPENHLLYQINNASEIFDTRCPGCSVRNTLEDWKP